MRKFNFKNGFKRVNDKFAIGSTLAMSTMWCVYIFVLWSIIPEFMPQTKDLFTYVAGAVQLIALPLIMVGQKLLNRKSEKRALQDHQTLMKQFQEIKKISETVNEHIEHLEKLTEDNREEFKVWTEVLKKLEQIEKKLD